MTSAETINNCKSKMKKAFDIFKSDLSFIDFNTEFNLNNSINSFYMNEGDTFEFASDEYNLGRKLFASFVFPESKNSVIFLIAILYLLFLTLFTIACL